MKNLYMPLSCFAHVSYMYVAQNMDPFFSHTILHGIFMCSPAGPVERSLSIIVLDIMITVSFSHQISHHIQMTPTAVFEKQTLAVHHTVFTNTDMHVNRASYPGSSGEEKTFLLVVINSELHSLTYFFSPCTWQKIGSETKELNLRQSCEEAAYTPLTIRGVSRLLLFMNSTYPMEPENMSTYTYNCKYLQFLFCMFH